MLFRFADSVVTASHGSMSHQAAGGSKSGGKGSRFSRGSSGANTRPYGSAGDLAGILGGGGGGNHSGGGDDYHHHRRSFGSSGVGGLEDLGGDGLDDSSASVSVVSSNYSVDDSGSAVCRVESDPVIEAGAEGGGGGSGSPCPKRGVAAAAAGAASSGRHRRNGFREGSGDPAGEKKVTVRKMAREMEGLKLTCAEMERSQMRAEQQMQLFVTG